ncbi:hypothetical protein VE04_05578 [Pseudogymnoascus sp. 24MN13]|nr:hypothetical protein VE04_05578 [Pseudogymnoascus sp. 24MN13]
MLMSVRSNQLALAVGVCLGTAQSGPVSIMSGLETQALSFQAIPQQLLDLSNVAATCLGVLKQTINCEEAVADLGQRQYHGSLESITITNRACVASYRTALTTARRRIEGAYAETLEVLPRMTVLSFINSIITRWDETCLKDTSGEYYNNIINALDQYDELEDIPKTDLYSYCYGAKLSLMQKSEYLAYDEYYAAILEEPPVYNGSKLDTCVSGKITVTKEGDSCDSVAIANSISRATLYYINENLSNCTSIKAGIKLCLPQPYTTHVVTANETCVSALGGEFEDGGSGGDGGIPRNGDTSGEGGSSNGYSDIVVDPPVGEIGAGTTKNYGVYVQAQEGVGCAKTIVTANRSTPMDLFLEVNPSLETAAKCDKNLKPSGHVICITAPGGDFKNSGSGGNSSNPSNGDIRGGGSSDGYADFIAEPPAGEIGKRITKNCSIYVEAQEGGVPVPTTTTRGGVPEPTSTVPSPVQEGIIDTCTSYYKASDGDDCSKLASRFGFTLGDFIQWNPAVNETCASFWLGYYYYVATPNSIPTTTTRGGISKPTSTVPSPVQEGIVDTCTSYYKASDSDDCSKLASRFGFTLSDFIQWNPAVDETCAGF